SVTATSRPFETRTPASPGFEALETPVPSRSSNTIPETVASCADVSPGSIAASASPLAAPTSTSRRVISLPYPDIPASVRGGDMRLCVRDAIMKGFSPDLPAMPEESVGEHAGRHRFADRNRANADAGIVAAFGDDLRILKDARDGPPRGQDRGGRLDREPGDNRLSGRNAAENAAGMIGEEARAPVRAPSHLVRVLLAREFGGREAVADLDALDRIDAHQRAREFGVELAVDRRAPAGGNALGHDLDHGADRRSGLADVVEVVGEPRGRGGVRTEERIFADRVPVPVGAVDLQLAELHQCAADRHTGNRLSRDGARHDARRRLARRGAAAASVVPDAVFGVIDVVGVARAVFVPDVAVVLGTLVHVLDENADRGPGRH